MSDPKLKPCPFCGGVAKILQRGSIRQSMQIACEGCGAAVESGDVYGMTAPERYAWNSRAITPGQRLVACRDFWQRVEKLCSPGYIESEGMAAQIIFAQMETEANTL